MPGRGEYYKSKYGRGGRGRGSGRGRGGVQPDRVTEPPSISKVRDWSELQTDLTKLDGSQYGAYNQIRGQFRHTSAGFILSIDRIQSDPYAPPSRVRVIMSWQHTGLPTEFLESDIRKIAVCDYLTRVATDFIRSKHLDHNVQNDKGGWSGAKGGAFNINSPGQEVLPRSSAMISGTNSIELRFTVALPAAGRSILGQQAWQILGVNLVDLIRHTLLHEKLRQVQLRAHVSSVEQQHALREQLAPRGLIAFVANGSILPRASGAAAGPMDKDEAVEFQSPKELEVALHCPDGSELYGMGIPRGITLLTGGGFHGKSTLLEALELGIYNHIPNDGRSTVVTDAKAVKIRAEDGRSVTGVDISPFVKNLPGGKDTKQFSTGDASGSTSMAANMQEALEAGCTTFLIDEDSSATNLLVRDARMQLLVQKEPITPLISKAKALYRDHGVSTVIVIGGLGDWLSVADNVILMDSYIPRSITTEAKAVVQKHPSTVTQDLHYGLKPERRVQVLLKHKKSPYAPRKTFISIRPEQKDPVDDPSKAEQGIDISGLDQIVEIGQTRMIAVLLEEISKETTDKAISLATLLDRTEPHIAIDKALSVTADHGGDVVAVRRFELAAAISRFRGLLVNR